MAKLYAEKIISGAINPKTGETWVLEDVPVRWREEVRELIEGREPTFATTQDYQEQMERLGVE